MYFDLEEARRVMTAAGLAVGRDRLGPRGHRSRVWWSRPGRPEGTLRPPGARVDMVVSRGPAAVRIPEVAGLTEIVARERIEAAGLRIGLVSIQRDGRGRPGTVLSQRPNPGSYLPKGGRVDLVVNDVRAR
jgi:serine/threonine-protein kinase